MVLFGDWVDLTLSGIVGRGGGRGGGGGGGVVVLQKRLSRF